MKKCPFCAEEIQDDAVKCRYCGEMLIRKRKWYFTTYALVIAFLCIGPFALPLLWFNPYFTQRRKIIVSIIVIILSWYLGAKFTQAFKIITDYYKLLNIDENSPILSIRMIS